MPIVVTDNGIEDARQAELGGFLVSLAEFSVTEATGFDVVSDRTQLVGTEVFRGKILTIEAVGRDSVRLTCAIPQGKPLTGQWNLSEIAIWNKNGRMFAHGSFATFPKSTDFGLKFYVFVTLARLGDVINITNTDTMSLPSAARVASLQPPDTSSQNVVSVLDSTPHEHEISIGYPNDTSSPNLAVKYGAGGTRWGFVGSSRVFEGKPEDVINQRVFKLDPGSYGFWLSDGEVVIVQVITGGGAGQSRKMSYVHSSKLFNVVDDPFVGLNGQSVIAMWRSHESALPVRHAGIPDYMVLGIGKNNYANIFASITATRLEPKLFKFVGTGAEAYPINSAQFPLDRILDTKHVLVQVDGKVLRPDQYTILGNQLRIAGGLPTGKDCTLYGFARSASDPGGITLFQDAVIASHGGAEYGLSTAPSDANNVFVFDSSGQQYGRQDFIVIGAKLVFADNSKPPVGRTLSFIVGGVSTSNAVRGSLSRQTQVAPSVTREITFTTNIADKNHTLLFVNGVYVPKQMYSVTGTTITTVDNIPQNAIVDLIVFSGEEVTSVSTRGGYDTGPQWVDPAGEQGMPNKLIPGRVTYLGLGWTSYPVDTVPSAEYLVAFVGNRYMPPTEYSYDGHNIFFNEIVTGNTPVEVFCFRSVEHNGTSARPIVTNVVTNGTRNVTVHPNANTQSLMVFVGREYQPSMTYSYNSSTGQITFNADVASGLTVCAWSYADQNVTGMQVKMFSTRQGMTSQTKYLMQGTLDQIQDVIPFSEGRLLGYNFTLTNESGASYINYGTIQPGWIGTVMTAVEFSSRIPQRRLALRSELDGFLRADNNLADVPNKAAARANLGIVDNPGGGDVDLSGLLTKVANLSDVPDKAAARQNLGITDIIANLMQNVLLKANNLSDVPDKAAARANLGIVDNPGGSGNIVANLPPGAGQIMTTIYGSVDFGTVFKIRFGQYVSPSSEYGSEGVGPTIQFKHGNGNNAPFSQGCFGVFASELNPGGSPWNKRDTVVQIADVSNTQFTVYRNQPGDASSYLRGFYWLAIGV